MKEKKIFKQAVAMLVLLSMVSAACSSEGMTKNHQSSREEAVTLKLLVIETGIKWNVYPDHAVAQEIAKKVGVKLEFVESDDANFNVLLAGGDLPDIIRAEPAKYGKQLIEGGLIVPMDDLLQDYGHDIMTNVPTVIEYSRESWSEGRNKLFFLPPQVQSEPSRTYPPLTVGPTMRWDYYKEIGAPEFNTPDQLLDVLEQIIHNHPETEDGKKIYGVSMWQDWGLFPYTVPFAWYTMQATNNSELMARKLGETQYRNILTDENSTYWVAADFYNKANRRGLLDPDALTMKHNDYLAKASAGQILVGPATWAMGDFNSNHAKDGKGYIVLPTGKRAWSGGVNPLGWSGKSYAISKASRHPEKAMELLNYLYSYEGARTMYSGVEGVHWEMASGKPQIKEETYELRKAGSVEWEKTGLAMDLNLIGLGGAVRDPKTNTPLDLFMTNEALARSNSELEQDFSDFYGGLHPGDVLSKRVAAGELEDSNTTNKGLTTEQLLLEAKVGLPAIPKGLMKIEAEVKELATRYGVLLILAETDNAFNQVKAEALKAFKDAGVDQITEFYTRDYAARREAVGAMPAKLNE